MKLLFKADKTFLSHSGMNSLMPEDTTYFDDNKEMFKKQFSLSEKDWEGAIWIIVNDDTLEAQKIMSGYIPTLNNENKLTAKETWQKSQYLIDKEARHLERTNKKARLAEIETALEGKSKDDKVALLEEAFKLMRK